MDFDSDESRAFFAIQHGGESRVVDLPKGRSFRIGSEGDFVLEDDAISPIHLAFEWDGETLRLELLDGETFVNGKRAEARSELKPGDEISIGRATIVVGISVRLAAGGRRALTHHEFRERLYEELARASRRGRHTSLVMIHCKSGEGRAIAATALDQFRAGDVVATYAADQPEFLLPDTDGPTTAAVVARILQAANVEADFGIAVAPEDGDNAERLFRAARKHLADRRGSRPPAREKLPQPAVLDESTRKLAQRLEDLAPNRNRVLLTGEISTGKSVFARFLHEKRTPDGRFVVINCASMLGKDAVQAAFGHGGDAAGAISGTLLLDEVADLSMAAQETLVEFLKEHGEDIFVVSSTQRTLVGLAERGAFSNDLLAALKGETFEVPALRNRPDDIIPLAEHFARVNGAPSPVRFSPGALARLRSYPWPGNVLELSNAMERAVELARGGEVLAEYLPNEPMPIASNEGRLREHVDGVERDAIIKALADSNNNQTHAARRLGISRRALIYKMEKYGLKRPPKTARRGAS